MKKHIFRAMILSSAIVLLASFALIMGVLYDYFGSIQAAQLRTELALAADAVENDGLDYLEALDVADCRLTWVASDGSVLFDSDSSADLMENHADREEIKSAFKTGTGESSRYSATLTEKTLYYAKLLDDGTVLRVSVSRMTVPALVMGMLQAVAVIFVIALVLALVLADRLSKRIVKPLNALDLEKPLDNETYDELSPLLTHIEQQHRRIRLQTEELAVRRSEFEAVIENMNEGLVLLNAKNEILSLNPAAEKLFKTDHSCIGREFLTVERSVEVTNLLRTAAEKGEGELQISRGGFEYQLNASRIDVSGEPAGTVILAFDVTDKVFAERNRREFTANVSHELKTPLQSIMGSAELIENGLVKPEDMPQFAGRIRSEAKRLVALIEDIIRLSQLDEQTELPSEPVELYELASEELASLESAAEQKRVSLVLEGEAVTVNGARQLLREVVHNLCENAVKYNIEGGSVTVTVARLDGEAIFRVRDTGIGIPPEHQTRVFERFYRVDKSHSKETGGTGLGLSIVKHAVRYLGGTIELISAPGEGTTITVHLPT